MKGPEPAERLDHYEASAPYIHIFAMLPLLKQIGDHSVLVDKSTEESDDHLQFQSDKLVLFDRSWNAVREDRTADRVNRIGQPRDVQVLKTVPGEPWRRRSPPLSKREATSWRKRGRDNRRGLHSSRPFIAAFLAPIRKVGELRNVNLFFL